MEENRNDNLAVLEKSATAPATEPAKLPVEAEHAGHDEAHRRVEHFGPAEERGTILVVDDDASMLRACERLLSQEGFRVITTGDPGRALELTESGDVDAAVIDLKMPEIDGLSLLRIMRSKRPEVVVLLMTAYADIDAAVTAVKGGAFDFLTKPFENADSVIARLDRAVEHKRLRSKAHLLEREVGERYRFSNIVGHAPNLQHIFRLIEKVAPSDSNVLINGESGTGKELVARSIHFNSARKDQPFVTLNCSAVTETLFESELFGHERGAFTGAVQRKRGLFEEAHHGTIFLDEIGEVPMSVQPKLLRVLQESEVRRVGGNETLTVDVRIIAATNKDLAQEVAAGRFREDLYYRLNVITIPLPPLRERKQDIPLLVQHFLEKYAARGSGEIKSISTEALQVLENYAWPGNIRELENVIERAIVLEEGGVIDPRDLPANLLENTEWAGLKGDIPMDRGYREAKQVFLDRFDKAYGKMMLQRYEGNVTLAAEAAGMDRSNFRKILQKAGLNPKEFKTPARATSGNAELQPPSPEPVK
jgi:two-component system response regulator HydG